MLTLLKYVMNHPLCQGYKLSALRRLLIWQISSRLMRVPHVVKFTSSTSLVVEHGMAGATGNFYCGPHEFEEMAFVLHLLRPHDLFVDVGANIGSYTILASGVSGANTIAVEPVPKTFSRLRKNTRYNDLDDLVTLYNCGIGATAATQRFTATLDTVNHVLLDSEIDLNAVEVPVYPLDNVLQDRNPVCIKIDVEGFEQEVVDGGFSTLQNTSVCGIVMELNGSGERYGYRDEVLHATMLRHDFAPFAYEPFQRALKRLPDWNRERGNTLYVRNLDFVRERLNGAPEIVLPWRRVSLTRVRQFDLT